MHMVPTACLRTDHFVMHRIGWSEGGKRPLNFIAPWLSGWSVSLTWSRSLVRIQSGLPFILLYYNWQIDMLEVHDRVSSNLTRRTILSVTVVVRSPMSSHITE